MESISKINDTNINKLCRTCLTVNTEEMISIFDEIDRVENDENVRTYICDMLLDVVLIEIDTKANLPTLICSNCLRLVQQFFNFKKQCNKSEAILLQYLTEKNYKVVCTKTSPKQDNVLNKKSAIRESIDIERFLNEDKQESMIIKTDIHELSNPSSSDDLLNARVKLEIVEEINKLDMESDTEKEDKVITLGAKKHPNQDCNILTEKSAIKESIGIENSLNEVKHESMFIKSDVDLSNPPSSDDLFNSGIRLNFETLHSNYNKDENVFTCQLCDKSFKTDALYFVHMKQHTEGNICTVCNKHFKHYKSLTNHMKQHTEDKCVCNICNKRFKHSTNLAAHLYTHKDEKRYSCKICGKQYKQSTSITVHMRMHAGQTPFLCSVCGKGFRESTSLKSHMRTHTKEKPYMCNICGITMAVQCHLVQHMRTHTGERPFKCIECNKAFRSSTELKRHSLIHTGLKPYSCDVCKKSFNRKSTLRLHAKIHTNERAHKCSLCEKSFIQAHSLRTHLLNHK